MQLDLNNLPSDPELLHRLVRDIATTIEHRDGEIERLKSIIKQLQRMQFGRRSERIDDDQLALGLEDLDSDIAQVKETATRRSPKNGRIRRRDASPARSSAARGRSARRRREDLPVLWRCSLHLIGESVSEMLDWVPAQLRVMRISRPKYACRACNTVVQAARRSG